MPILESNEVSIRILCHLLYLFQERTFQCPSCPRAFATSWQAKSHIKNNHGHKKTYKCQKCTKAIFKTPQALAGHVKSFHKVAVKAKKASNTGGSAVQVPN